jgi:hypothetical protein
MKDDAAVYLRVIHPRTQEEFPLAGNIRHDPGTDGYAVWFSERGMPLVDAFRSFVASGRAPEACGDAP